MKENLHEVCVITYCPFCGKAHEIEVNEMDYLDWQDGMLAQEAFPYLEVNEREMLISGICPDCWNGMFGQVEEDEDIPDDEAWTDDGLEMGFNPYMGAYDYDC